MNQIYIAGNKIIYNWFRINQHCQKSFKKYAKQLVDIKVEMSNRRSRGLVMFTCYLQTGRWSRPATVCGFSLCSLQICLHSRDRTLCNFCTPTPHRERQLSLTHFLSFSRPDRLARTCFHQTTNRSLLQTAYSPATRLTAYSQLPHHQLHSPRHSFPPPVAP